MGNIWNIGVSQYQEIRTLEQNLLSFSVSPGDTYSHWSLLGPCSALNKLHMHSLWSLILNVNVKSQYRCCFNLYFLTLALQNTNTPPPPQHIFGLSLLCYVSVPDSGIHWTISHTRYNGSGLSLAAGMDPVHSAAVLWALMSRPKLCRQVAKRGAPCMRLHTDKQMEKWLHMCCFKLQAEPLGW